MIIIINMRSVLIIAKQILKFYHLPKSIYIFNNSYSFLIICIMVTMHSLLLMRNSSSSVYSTLTKNFIRSSALYSIYWYLYF